MGIFLLPVTVGTTPTLSIMIVDFLVVDWPSPYNVIIGQLTLKKLRAATSTYHLMLKFSIEEGMGEVTGDQLAAKRCYNISMKKISDPTTLTMTTVCEAKGEPVEPLEEVVVWEGKVLQIGTCLTLEVREGLVNFLQKNMEVFVWSHEDMPRISPEDIVNILNVDPTMKPVKQKRRNLRQKESRL